MSGLVKGIKKVFKKVANFVKKYWKYIVIAVAVYFTAGVALSYFGGTAGFASAMPGFGTGGLFSKAAVAMGFKGSAAVASGLSTTSGVWAGATGAAMGSTLTAAEVAAGQAAAAQAAITGPGVTTTGLGAAPSATTVNAGTAATANSTVSGLGTTSQVAAATTPTAATGAMTATDAAMKAMSGAMKMQAASTLLKTAGGLFAPDPDELDEKAHARRNAQAFGVGRNGDDTWGWGQPMPGTQPTSQPSQFAPTQAGQASSAQGGGSMYNPQAQGGQFIGAPTGGTTASNAQQGGDFIVQPQPAGGGGNG